MTDPKTDRELIAEARRQATVPNPVGVEHGTRFLLDALADRLEALTAEHEKTKRGARTLGGLVERHCHDLLRWSGVKDDSGTGDADYELAWEIVEAMPARVAALTAADRLIPEGAEVREEKNFGYAICANPYDATFTRTVITTPWREVQGDE